MNDIRRSPGGIGFIVTGPRPETDATKAGASYKAWLEAAYEDHNLNIQGGN